LGWSIGGTVKVESEKGGRAVYYIADFKYVKDGKTIYEDVESVQTA